MNTAKQVGQSARDLAQKIARRLSQEPLEVLKTARDQVTSLETSHSNPQPNQINENQPKNVENQQKLQDKMKSGRRMEALNRELSDIHKQDLFKNLQGKISQGIEVPLEDYPELSMDQKQVLKAQTEAVKNQMINEQMTNDKLIIPTSKRGRRFGQTQKQEAEKQQTRVEKPVPPSG